MLYLENLFTYFKSREISRSEKLLLLLGTAVYVLSPADLLPFNPIDDIGVIGAVMAYINWRVKHIKAVSLNSQETAKNSVIDTEVIDGKNFFTDKKN